MLLFAPGAGGRIRIGAGATHQVRVANLEFEVCLQLELVGALVELVLTSEQLLTNTLTGATGQSVRLPFPPRERIQLSVGAARGSRPPFGLSLEPVLVPGRGA